MEYKWTALTVTTVGATMGGIDTRIAIIGLPTIAAQLGAGAEEVIWITQAYLLSSTILLLFFGRTSDLLGRVKLYNAGFVIFTIGSGLCALSLNAYMLIAFRIIQGAGASLLFANSAAIITDASPRSELGLALGINATGFRIGAMAGLTLSGLILSVVDWRGLFYVNIPIGIFGTLWAHWRLKEISQKDTVTTSMDWLGFVLFSVGLTLLLLALTFFSYGEETSQLSGAAYLVAGIILIGVFFVQESKARSPLLDPKLFKIRPFAMGNICELLIGLAWAGAILLVPLYLQLSIGYTPLAAGIAVLPLEISFLVSSLISGRLADVYDPRILTTSGLALIAIGLGVVSTLSEFPIYLELAFALILIGIGSGLFTMPLTRAVMASVPSVRRGIASAFTSTVFNVGFTASYGLVILLITLEVPYGAFSSLLQNSQGVAISSPSISAEFLSGFHLCALILAIMVAIAIVPATFIGARDSTLAEDKSHTF